MKTEEGSSRRNIVRSHDYDPRRLVFERQWVRFFIVKNCILKLLFIFCYFCSCYYDKKEREEATWRCWRQRKVERYRRWHNVNGFKKDGWVYLEVNFRGKKDSCELSYHSVPRNNFYLKVIFVNNHHLVYSSWFSSG